MKTKTTLALMFAVICLVVGTAQAQQFDNIPPEEVVNLKVQPGAEEAFLTWDPAVDDTGVVQYKIYYGTESVNADGGYYQYEVLTKTDETEYKIEKLEPNVPYYFAVTALDAEGNESLNYSLEAQTMPTQDPAPEKIEGLRAEPGVEEVSLSWEEGVDNEEVMGYKLYYGTDPEDKTETTQTLGNNYTITNLMGDTTYYFAVSAVDNKDNEGEMSETVSAMVAAEPVAPVIEEVEDDSTAEGQDSMPASGAALFVPAALAFGLAGLVRRSKKK